MEESNRNGCMIVMLFLLVAGMAGCSAYMRASAQQTVWAREGVHLSVVEILLGAKPAERVITIKQGQK